MPFNVGGPELIILLVIVFVVFGAGKLPEVFGAMGKGVREFRKAQTEEGPGSSKEEGEDSKA